MQRLGGVIAALGICVFFAVGASRAEFKRAPYWQWDITPFHWHNGMHNPCYMDRRLSDQVQVHIEAARDWSFVLWLRTSAWQFGSDTVSAEALLRGRGDTFGIARGGSSLQGDRILSSGVTAEFEGLTEHDLFSGALTVSTPNFPPYTIPTEVMAELHKRIGECGQR